MVAALGGAFRRAREQARSALAAVTAQREELRQTLARLGVVFRDASEPERAEAARRHLAAIVESSEDAIYSKDLDGIITSWNAAAERVYGYAAADVIGRPFAVLMPPDRAAEAERLVARIRRGDHVAHFETVRMRKDGRPIDVSVSYSPVRDADGRLAGSAVITRDVSVQKQALAALKASEARFAAVIQNAPAVVFVKDPDGVYLMANTQFAAYAGRPVEDILGRTDAELFAPEVAVAFRKEDEGVLAEGRVQTFEEAFPYQGVNYTFLTAKFPLSDSSGRPMAVCGIATDITARKAAEERVVEEGRIAETLGRIGMGLASELDLQKVVQLVTDEATRLTEAQFGAFFYNVLSDRGESYMLYALAGVLREKFERFPMPRNTAVFEPTFRAEGVVRLDDVTTDPRYGKNPPYNGMPRRALAGAAATWRPRSCPGRGTCLGGLFFGHSRAGVFTDRHERLVTGIAAQAAIAIDNARLYGRVQESEERFRQLAEHIAAVFWLMDVPTGRVLYVSPAYLEIWGRLPESLYADGQSFLKAIHPDDRERVRAAAAAQARGEPLSEEYRVVRPDGSVRWVVDRGFPIRDADGQGSASPGWPRTSRTASGGRAGRFLAGASSALAALADVDSTLQKVAAWPSRTSPTGARWTWPRRTAAAAGGRRPRRPGQGEAGPRAPRRCPPDPAAPTGVPQIIRTGQSEMVADITDAACSSRAVKDPELPRHHARSWACGRTSGVPLDGPGQGARGHHVHRRRVRPAVRRRRPGRGRGPGPAGGRRRRERPAVPGRPGGRPAEGRVPGDAGPRTAQPARPDPQRAADPASWPAADPARPRPGPRHDGAAGPPPGPAGGRPAGRVAGSCGGRSSCGEERVELAAVVARAVETAQPLIEARRHELTVAVPPDAGVGGRPTRSGWPRWSATC